MMAMSMTMDLAKTTTDELFTLARASEDPDAYWECVTELQSRGDERVFKLAEVLCDSIMPGERCLGADVLGQLSVDGYDPRPILRRLLDEDDQPAVIAAAAAGAGFQHDQDAKERLESLIEHPETGVRFAALHALVRLDASADGAADGAAPSA
jgi:HEAT repeat protein